MRTRSVSRIALVSALVGLACTGCGSDPECTNIYIPPTVTGSFEASSVPFTDVSELLVCLEDRCDSTVASRVSIRIERTPSENPTFGSSSTQPPKPHKVFVSFSTRPASAVEPRTGAVLRLRFPNQATGPWTTDVSLTAKVTPGDQCTPTTGTFERQ